MNPTVNKNGNPRKFSLFGKDLANKKQSMDYIDLSFLDVNKDKIIVKLSDVTEEKI